jgi:D-amino peptidase
MMERRYRKTIATVALLLAVVGILALVCWGAPQTEKSKKVYMITDMEGVSGIYDSELQVEPFQSPRWEESRKLLTGEVNAAVEGLLAGGATDVVVVSFR